MEGSSDSVVLERLCAAFEKKGAGAEGKGVRLKDSGRRVPSPAWKLESVLVCCRESSDKVCMRGIVGGGCSECTDVCAYACVCISFISE